VVRSLFFFLVVHLLFHPLPGLTYFLCLAKESRQRKAPRWRPPPWIFVAGREGRQTRCAQTASLLYPPRNKNPRRHQGPNVKRQRPTHREVGLVVLLGAQMVCLFAFDFPLCGALNFCCKEEKERRLFERSEFASSPSLRQKFKESFAASGAPFFAYFLWQDKESESVPAGNEREVDHPVQSLAENAIRESGAHEQPNSQDDADDNNKAAQHLLRQPVQQPRPSKPACDAANAQGQHRRPVHLRRERKYRHG